MVIRNLSHHTLGLLQDQDRLLTVKMTHGANAVFIVGMGRFGGNVLTVAAESASSPVMGFADFPGILGSGGVGTSGILMGRCDVCVQIAVADTSVGAVAAFLFQANLTAGFAQQGASRLTAFADIAVVEAVAAVLAEMELIITVLYAHGRRFHAIGIALAAIQAQFAKVAHFDLAECLTAVGTQMVVPIGIFYTIFAAGAALGSGVVHTAEYAQTAIIAQFNAVLEQAFLTLLTDDTAFFTVQIFILTDFIGAVAVAALFAVHQLQLRAAHAEAAAVAQTALHTVAAGPADTAQFFFRGVVTFQTDIAMPAVIHIAVRTHTAIGTEIWILKRAGAALAAVGSVPALRVRTFGAATAAYAATVFIPVIMVAEPAFHTVFPVCEDRGRH